MIKLLLTIVAGLSLAFSPPLMASAPADSCLKLICPNNYKGQTNDGCYNPDSVKVDSCLGSATYGKIFAAKYYFMQFALNSYPFAEVLKKNEIKNVSDILPVYSGLKSALLNLQNKFGTIYFQGLPIDTIFAEDYTNPVIRVFFEHEQPVDGLTKEVMDSVPTIRGFAYHDRYIIGFLLVSNSNTNLDILFPNPSKDFIKSETFIEGEEYTVINELGINLQSGTIFGDNKIDVRDLLPGMYYIRISNKFLKFVKE